MSLKFDKQSFLEIAEQNNILLTALASHPKFNKENPAASPKPLWFASDFVRRTIIEYILPLAPKDAQNKSTRFANKAIFPYSPPVPGNHPPFPESANDEWLADDKNWPKNTTSKAKELYGDVMSRSAMIAMLINDPMKGAMMLGGQFDWSTVPQIVEVTRLMGGSAEDDEDGVD